MICDQQYTIVRSGWGEPGTAIKVRALVETGKIKRFSVRASRDTILGDDIFETDEQVIEAARLAHKALGEILRLLESRTE